MPSIEARLGKDMLVIEGGSALMLQRYGLEQEACPEILNIIEPDLITEIHRLYNLAGATCAISNTYGANAPALAKEGLQDNVEDINRRGVEIAQSIHPQHVLADMGSCGIWNKDEDLQKAAFAAYAQQASALASANPDAIYIETMDHLGDALCALDAATSVCDLPVFVSLAVNQDGRLLGCNTLIEDAAAQLLAHKASALGLNCSLTPISIIEPAKRLAACCPLPLLACPDVSLPENSADGTVIYNGSTHEMETAARMLHKLGFMMIGSCCGSTPAYTGAIYAAVGEMDVVSRSI